MIWNKNQDSSMVERQARDLEVRVRIPFQVQIFLLKFMKCKCTKAQVIRFIFTNNLI